MTKASAESGFYALNLDEQQPLGSYCHYSYSGYYDRDVCISGYCARSYNCASGCCYQNTCSGDSDCAASVIAWFWWVMISLACVCFIVIILVAVKKRR